MRIFYSFLLFSFIKKNWKKFGDCTGVALGQLEEGITYFGEEVQFVPVENKVYFNI